MFEIRTRNYRQTEKLGEILAQKAGVTVYAMFGEMGCGKTVLSRGIVKGLGVDADVTSPTFALINEYRSEGKSVYHFDMYRIGNEDDLYSTGYYDYLDSGSALIIEWSENIVSSLPDDCVKIYMTKTENPDERVFKISGCEEFELTCD